MIYQIDPLSDVRWDELVQKHRNSSIFHTSGWLEALRRAYGYEPVVYTTSPLGGELTNGVVFSHVSSWLTGRRMVSLPFSDHCDPLVENGNSGLPLLEELCKEQGRQNWKYVEVRPRNDFVDQRSGLEPGKGYCFHTLDLRPDEKTIFSNFHKSCTQRKIYRADKVKMKYVEGRSSELLRMFYHLFVQTRWRHHIPPQPFHWFESLAECLGPAMQVRAALCGGRLAASILTLRFRNSLVYKYGCSDAELRNLGGMQWLFWKVICEAKSQGLHELDLGRSDWDNPGLITFKDRLGGKRFSLSYWQYPKAAVQPYLLGVLKRPVSWIVGHTPLSIVTLAGRTLYRHIG